METRCTTAQIEADIYRGMETAVRPSCGSIPLEGSPFRIKSRATLPVVMKNMSSNQYLQFSPTSGTSYGVLMSPRDLGKIMKEIFILETRTGEYLFCCRIYVKNQQKTWFLSYEPSGEQDRTVDFMAYDHDENITHLDGRCFVYSKDGDYLFLRAFCRRDLYVCWDDRTRTYVLKELADPESASSEFKFLLIRIKSRILKIAHIIFPCFKPNNRIEPDYDLGWEKPIRH